MTSFSVFETEPFNEQCITFICVLNITFNKQCITFIWTSKRLFERTMYYNYLRTQTDFLNEQCFTFILLKTSNRLFERTMYHIYLDPKMIFYEQYITFNWDLKYLLRLQGVTFI